MAESATAEVAILQVEDRSSMAGADTEAVREALAAAAVARGFSPLARDFVDRQAVDLDRPSVDVASVLRVRLLDWEVQQEPLRIVGRVHASMYEAGKRLADVQTELDLSLPATDPGGSYSARLARLRLAVAEEIWRSMPAPRDEDSAHQRW